MHRSEKKVIESLGLGKEVRVGELEGRKIMQKGWGRRASKGGQSIGGPRSGLERRMAMA